MDLNFHIKFAIKKLVSSHLKKYSTAKKQVFYLQQVVPSFMKEKLADKPLNKRVIFASLGWYDARAEAIYLKALEAMGYEPYILMSYDPYVAKIFKIFGINKIFYYEDIFKKISFKKCKDEAEYYVKHLDGEGIVKIVHHGINIGKYAASSYMRQTRKGSLNLDDSVLRGFFIKQLSNSIRAVYGITIILNEIQPSLVFMMERGYTPTGQLFEACMNKKIPVINRTASHKSGWDIIRRYSSLEEGMIHPHSLSIESWEILKKMDWNDDKWKRLYNELKGTYESGDWFSEVGTQFNKKVYTKNEIVSKLQINVSKKTAIIFPHMFWDATFFYGEDLFEDYYDWFVNVLKAAAENKNLNWIVKIHPANVVKAKRDNYKGEHKEIIAIHETIGSISEHIKIIPPESDINTFSLFKIMDYCLTVRGTIGIETSAMGINTLTAGTGRYDRHGFTYDFNSKKDYLDCIYSLETMQPMTAEVIELARRFAYGTFIMRPIELDLLEYGFTQSEKADIRYRPLFRNRDEFEKSSFVRGLRDFVASGAKDYLNEY